MNNKETIVHVIDEMGIGGAEILLISTIRLLVQYNHVIVSLFPSTQTLDNRINLDGYESHCLNITSKFSWPGAVLRMRDIIKKTGPVLVHAHLQRAGFVAKLAVPKAIPLFYSLHTAYTLEIFRFSKLAVIAERLTAKPRHHLIGVSQYVIDDYQSVVPNSGTTDKLYNFVDDDFFLPNDLKDYIPGTPLRCVGVGNFKKSKNYPYTLAAFNLVKHLPITLDIYGLGLEMEPMQAMIDAQDISNVTIKGGIRNVSEVLPGYHAYVMSSTYEGFGISPLEGMATGLPALLSDIPIFREIVGTNGILFDLSNPAELATRLQELYEGKINWKTYSNAAKETARRIASSAMYQQQLIDIYHKYPKAH